MDRDGRAAWRRSSLGGFTLPELLMVLLIGSILLLLATSSFEHYIGRTQADTTITRLRTALALARAEAVKRSASVVLCRVGASPGECAGTAATGRNDWSSGWLLFVDVDRNRLFDVGGGDELVRAFPAVESSLILRWNRGDFIAYQGSGSLNSLNGSFCLAGTADLTRFQRELVIPYSGRVRATSGACSYTLTL